MKLNSVILADDSELNGVSSLFVMLEDSTFQLLEQYATTHDDVEVNNNAYLSDSISKQGLSEIMSLVNSDSFMCFWYGHGKTDSFKVGNEEIITTTENYYLFSNALIYTFSCLNGNDLADAVIANKAETFVGYTSNANCPYGLDELTTGIVTSFITSLFDGKTINEAKVDLEISYDNAIYDDSLDPFQRQSFQENRDNLIVKGNGNIKLNDIMIDTL